MFLQIIVTLIILLIGGYFIYKRARKAWKTADKEERGNQLDEKIEGVDENAKLAKRARKVDVKQAKKDVDDVDKIIK